MGVIDIVCLIILVLWLLLGLKRGFIYEILCIAVTVLVFVLTYIVHPMLTDIVGKIATPSAALNHIVFIISFVVVGSIVQIFTNKIVTTLGTFEKIGTVSRILGAITSTFRGTIYLSLALWLLVSFLNPQSSISQQIQNGAISSNTQKVAATFYNGMASLMNNSEIEADEKL